MHRYRLLATTLFLAYSLSPCDAQPTGLVGGLNERISITQSLRDKNTANEPAFASVTVPDDGRVESLVAVAARFTRDTDGTNPKFRVGAATQYNYNSALGARQNVFFGGGQVELRTGSKDPGRVFRFTRVKGTGGYKRNGEAHTKAIEADAYATYEQNRPESDGTTAVLLGRRAEIAPQVGLEFERIISAATAEAKGQRIRAMLAAQINVTPAPVLADRLVFSGSFAYRRDVQTDFAGSDRDHPFGQVGVAVALDPNKVFSIAVERLLGDDPTQGFSSRGQWRMGLKVHYNHEQKKRIDRARALRAPAAPTLTASTPKNRII